MTQREHPGEINVVESTPRNKCSENTGKWFTQVLILMKRVYWPVGMKKEIGLRNMSGVGVG